MSSFSGSMQCQSLYEDNSFFKRDNGMGRKLALKMDQKQLNLKHTEKHIRASLKITDFSLIRTLQDHIPSPNQDALVPQLEELPASLMDLKGSITATIEDLERMDKSGRDGPLSLLSNAPSVQPVVDQQMLEADYEQSSELHLLEDNEPSMNIEELLRSNSPYSSSRKNSEPFSVSDHDNSPASVFSGTSSPAHFFEQTTDQLPTTLELTSGSTFGFMSGLTPKIEDAAFTFDVSSLACSSSSMSGMFVNGDSSNPSDNRYVQMRRKNNIASKRSRQTRKEKEIENEIKAKKLQEENALLKRKVQELEEKTERVKKYLILTVMKKR